MSKFEFRALLTKSQYNGRLVSTKFIKEYMFNTDDGDRAAKWLIAVHRLGMSTGAMWCKAGTELVAPDGRKCVYAMSRDGYWAFMPKMEARFVHDCPDCKLHMQTGKYDIYKCNRSKQSGYLWRWGNEAWQYVTSEPNDIWES